MGNTEVIVTNLSQNAVDLLGGKTSAALDLPDEFSIRLTKSVQQLSELNKISTEAALGVSFPFTPTNDLIFSNYGSPLVLENKVFYYNIQAIVDGHALQFTRLWIRKRNEKSRTWEAEFTRDPNHWVELASQVKTNDLDFGLFYLGRSQLIANWATPAYNGDYTNPSVGQPPTYWPLIDYGGWCDETEVPQGAQGRFKSVALEDFRPLLSLVYILKAGFCKIGWSIESTLFEAEVIKRAWVYALNQNYYDASGAGGKIVGRVYTLYDWPQNGVNEYLRFEDFNGQADNLAIMLTGFDTYCFAGVHNWQGVGLKYRLFLKGTFWNDRALPFTAIFQAMELVNNGGGPNDYGFTGEAINDELFIYEFAANQKIEITIDTIITLKPDQIGALHINVRPSTGFKVMPGVYFRCEPASQCLMGNGNVEVKNCVSDENSILDWTKSFVQMTRGLIETDLDTKTVYIYPRNRADVWGAVSGGFIKEEEAVIDISDVVISDSGIITPVRNDLKRFTRFGFKASTDAYIKSLNLLEPAHSRTLLNSVELPNAIEKIENPVIEPTLEGLPAGLASGSGGREPLPYLPRLWDNTDGKRSFSIAPRILIGYGSVKQINPSPITAINSYTSVFLDTPRNPANTGLLTTVGYATQSPTWRLFGVTEYYDWVFGIKPTDLFTVFYLGYTQDNRSGNVVDLLMTMKMKDYLTFDFRSLFRFYLRGLPVIAPMTSIRDFSSGRAQTPTPVTFFVSPASLECCDLPCGCQFIECDYWQDLGILMRQSTLDDWFLTSFTIDDIEQLSGPLSFGVLKIIDIGGKPYVTNLVDLLNSLGLPYFSFDYSIRIDADKGLRFFSIKHLACQNFRIEISELASPIWEYTQDSQLQAQFNPPNWEPAGYNTFYDTPIGCITTTEY